MRSGSSLRPLKSRSPPDHPAFDRIAIPIPQQTKEDSMRRVVAVTALVFAFATSAEARTHHHHYRHYAHHQYQQQAQGFGFSSFAFGNGYSGYEHSGYQHSGYERSSYGRSRSGGRPAAWCGWYMRSQVGADPGPEYNLARSWAHYGSNAGGPSVGTIVVWSHHVGKIVGQQNGQWIVESGNDGHAVRTRPRSLAGAIAFRNAYASF
jgi:hypothetical protein